jgi:SpoVK/Ycf46/Vps4 family AAA+-type ATPase
MQLGAALTELDNLVGVPEVKKSIRAIVEAMLCNYDKELQAQETDAICLNRVFVGNPGTGKTTVAKLYARILCAAGMLSKGDVVERTASDFMGVAVGESAQKTVNILKLSEGKVLVIDEAYNLFDSQSKSSGNASHGKQVFDIACSAMKILTFVPPTGFGYFSRESVRLARRRPRHHHDRI